MKFMSLAFSFTLFLLGSINHSAYSQSCDCPAITNLLTNADFSMGDVGFWSDLDFEDYCDGSSYDVGNEGRDKCDEPIWIDDTWDHTIGTSAGSYMIVNGPSHEFYSVYNRIWAKSVPVVLGETYTFYFHVLPKLTYTDSELKLAFYVNDDNVSGTISFPDITEWTEDLCYEWTATSTGFVTPNIRQVENFDGWGYDYGIDDVYFGICEETTAPCDVSANWTYDVSPNDCQVVWNNISMAGDGTTIIAYHWEFGDGTSSDEEFPTHYYDEPGIYEVCLTVYGVNEEGECCTSKLCGFVEITCSPEPCEAHIYSLSYSIYDYGDCILQFATSAVANRDIIGWFWNFGDGETGTGQFPTHDYASDGTYTVCVTVVLDDGDNCCSETICRVISFDCDGLPDTYIAQDTNPNMDIHLQNNPADELQIFPNPTNDWVEIKFSSAQSQEYQLQIFDLQGKLILRQNAAAEKGMNKKEIDIQKLPAGTYILNVVLKGKAYSEKLIVI